MIEKQKIVDELKLLLEQETKAAKESYEMTRSHATEGELKSEGKYDTRSIEAGYLASAQKKRLEELEHEKGLLQEIDASHQHSSVSVGSLVEIEFNSMTRLYFIASTSGGKILKIDDRPILVISAFSPIGVEAINLRPGDSFEVEASGELREYKVLNVY